MRTSRLLLVLFVLAFAAIPAFAGVAPSKTAANQSIAARDADLAVVRDAASNEQVAQILAANGLSQQEVNQKLAQMSSEDLHQLAQNVDQLHAAGLTQQQWIYIGIGALAVLLIVVLTR